jgi:hypothetical protein
MMRINSLQKKRVNGRRPLNNLKGQVAIESTVAIIAVFIFLLGATQIFIWMNRNIIFRQKAYQSSRLNLGNEDAIEFRCKPSQPCYKPSQLYVFPQEKP